MHHKRQKNKRGKRLQMGNLQLRDFFLSPFIEKKTVKDRQSGKCDCFVLHDYAQHEEKDDQSFSKERQEV